MNFRRFISSILSKRHLVKRKFKHLKWQLQGYRFASNRAGDQTICLYKWANYSCPVVNHPSQAHLLQSKVENMKKAAAIFDELLIQPKELCSFWKLVGNPNRKGKFHSGPTFEYGEVVQSTGGGLCQISGLIYNLALESGLEIRERHPHSIDAYGERRYLPLGRDATVAWVSKDLCFYNPWDFPVVLKIQAFFDHAEGQVFSSVPKNFDILIEQICEEQMDSKGRSVRKAKINRRIKMSGTIKTLDSLGWDVYHTL